jgi:hypothetical protein
MNGYHQIINEDITLLINSFSSLTLDKTCVLEWLTNHFKDNSKVQNIIENISNDNIYIKDKYYNIGKQDVLFAIVIYNSRTRSRHFKNIVVPLY